MKKIVKKLKGKKVLSLVLAAIMLATTFNMALPVLKMNAEAADVQYDTNGNIIIDGVTQERVVSGYESTYENYAAQYLNGASNPTGIVIPGLNAAQDYVIQGMTYYPKRDWMLVTAYHNYDSETDAAQSSSKVFALDAATGDFVAMFSFINVDGTTANVDHGGGIAVSEHNIYYACGDQDRKIAYAPISALENAPLNAHTQIQLVAEKDFVEVGSVSSSDKTAYTAYVCYDEGILWTGNFYDPGASLIGINIAATDYNAPANNTYNSMVFGYKLQGSTSEEEWANLVGAKGTDCQGNPSYAIGLSNAIKDVQYAVVDNGKLYLSRSFGSGAGNSVNFGFGETSLLTVADIDLSQPGTTSVKISTTSTDSLDKEITVHEISNYKDYDMMPMSEGLCFIDDELFITFEGASNKYLNESSGLTAIGNCEKPVDVIWQLDPYELVEIEKTAQEKSTYYERINSLNDIKDGDEYIILFKSAEEDPVTQNKILYAFNSDGNFRGHKLSKGNMSEPIGYDGMIGHKITEYVVETGDDGKERLYLTNPEKDDTESVRWIINKTDGYSIKSTDTYFANFKNFYVSADEITMAPDNAPYLSDLNIGQLGGENGYFYISKGGQYFLWCNDGTDEQVMATVNEYYAKTAGYSGITEVAGTFHCNATNSPILGGSVPEYKTEDYPDIWYPDGAFQIYRREVDSTSSAFESRVYSNMDTKLEADGTYTVTLDTYAISPNHYQYVGERPTDYIIVADTSNSMNFGGSTGIREFSESDTLTVGSLSDESDTADDRGEGIVGYSLYNSSFDIRYLHTDGKYYKMYMAVNNTEVKKTVGILSSIKQYYFLYYIADDGKYYCFSNEGKEIYTYTEAQFKEWVANPEQGNGYPYQTASSTDTTNSNRRTETLFTGKHYRFDNINSTYAGEHTNIDSLKTTAQNLVEQIAAQNDKNRIALVQYGATNGFYNTSGVLSTTDYANAFWSTSAKDNLKNTINGLSTGTQTDTSGIEMTYAYNIITNSGVNYKSGGERNVAVIFLSDGIPGKETETKDCDTVTGVTTTATDATTAANNIITTAKNIKESGAFIYTVLFGNNSAESFSKKTYMDAVSSKYPAATSMTSLGGQSVDGITYALNIATASYDYFVNFGSIACKEVAVNNAVGLDNLDAGSYLREVLGDALIFPENDDDYSIETQFVPGEYDEIGRFAFGTPYNTTEVTTDIDITTKTITVTGYDYSAQYISKGNDGKALRVVIKGLLADDGKEDLSNEIVTVDEKTGIYKGEDEMKDDDAFRSLPTERISIPEYTYVLDYGVNLYDSDVNGTMLALDNGLNAQPKDADGNITYRDVTDGDLIEMTNGKQDLIYKMNPTSTGDKGYVLIQRPDGEYDWFKLNVVPASNIYFEENEIETSGTSGKIEWTEEGSADGVYLDATDRDDVYGYEEHYDDASQSFSNNSYLQVNVTNEKGQTTSKKKSFTFTGTGFDLMSACGKNTGVLAVGVKKFDEATQKLKTVKAFMVDTYYDDANVSTLLSQVPVVKWEGAYGTYTVDISAVYVANAGGVPKSVAKNNLIDTGLVMNSAEPTDTADVAAILESVGMEDMIADDMELVWFDDNSIFNGGTGVAPTVKKTREGETAETVTLQNYIDGFRVYNPLGTDQSAYEDSEKNAKYVNVLDNLISSTDSIGSIGYIIGDSTNLTWADYQSVGPQGEVYLNKGESISFNVTVDQAEKVMLGLRAVNGSTSVTIAANDTYKVENVPINSRTEMYYDITPCFGGVTGTDQLINITITNANNGILAVNHVKHSGGDGSVGSGIVTRTNARSADATQAQDLLFVPFTEANLADVQNSMNLPGVQGVVKNGVIIPLVEEDDEISGDTTTPDTGDDNTNNDTNTDSGEKEEFSIFSLIEMIISLIEKILHGALGTGSLF